MNLKDLRANPDWTTLPLFDRKGWKRVKFGDVVENLNETCDPVEAGIERFIGLEHLEPGSLHIRSWGNVADGTTFTRRAVPGQVLFGKRRAYQRKVAVSDFEAVVSGDIYVLAPKGDRLLPDLLPFLCHSDRFFKHAVGTSAGSLSPRTNWSSLANFEFDLPPLERQRHFVKVLASADDVISKWTGLKKDLENNVDALAESSFLRHQQVRRMRCSEICELITVGIVVKPAALYTEPDRGVLALRSLNVFPGRFSLEDVVYLTHQGHQMHTKSQLRGGDVVVVRTGRPGDAALVPENLSGSNLIDLILVRTKKALDPAYLVEFVNSNYGRRQVLAGTAGTAQQHLNVSQFERLSIPVPSLPDQRKLAEKITDLRMRVAECQSSCDYSVELRGALVNALLA